jgi:hypothetical protein
VEGGVAAVFDVSHRTVDWTRDARQPDTGSMFDTWRERRRKKREEERRVSQIIGSDATP